MVTAEGYPQPVGSLPENRYRAMPRIAAGAVDGLLADVQTCESVFFHQVIADVLECGGSAVMRSEIAQPARDRLVGADPNQDFFGDCRRSHSLKLHSDLIKRATGAFLGGADQAGCQSAAAYQPP